MGAPGAGAPIVKDAKASKDYFFLRAFFVFFLVAFLRLAMTEDSTLGE